MDAVKEATIDLQSEDQAPDSESIFRDEYRRIARTIARITRDPGRAEELAVEVFLRFASHSSVGVGNQAAWLFRTAVRMALDELRRHNRKNRLQACTHFLKAPLNPEELHFDRDRQARVNQVLSQIRRRDAELLLLRAEGLAYEELATALRINPASIGTLLFRAQKAFRKEYVKRYGQPE